MRRSFGSRLEGVAVALLALLNLATLLGLLGASWWGFELFSHFTVQFALAQAALLLLMAARRALAPILLSLPFLLINFYPLAGYYKPTAAAAHAPREERTLRLMALNLRFDNERIDLVERAVRKENPDIILFSEADADWAQLLDLFRAAYPYEIRTGRIRLVSRVPLDEARTLELGSAAKPTALARICRDSETCLTLIGAHTERPRGAAMADSRNTHLAAMAALAAATDGRAVVFGDMNITPWSPWFRRVLAAGALRDSALGRGVHPTWMSRYLVFGLPIDHVLVGDGIAVLDRHIGEDVGSDHYPLIADIAF